MLDSRQISAYPRHQPVGGSNYTSKIIIMRKKLAPGHSQQFDGPMGVNEFTYFTVAKGWPCSIVPRGSDTEFIGPGETEKGDYILTCAYKIMRDRGLLIRSKDIIIDPSTNELQENGSFLPRRFLVLWSHDPMNTRLQIIAGLQYGVADDDLDEQS